MAATAKSKRTRSPQPQLVHAGERGSVTAEQARLIREALVSTLVHGVVDEYLATVRLAGAHWKGLTARWSSMWTARAAAAPSLAGRSCFG
jgi:hypothetical protein